MKCDTYIAGDDGGYLESASEARATIVKAPADQQPLSTIYVSSGSGQYKTFLVTNNNPITLKSLGMTSGPATSRLNIPTEDNTVAASTDSTDSSSFIKATSLDPTQLMQQNHPQPIAQARMSDFVNDIIAKSPIKASPIPKTQSGEDPIVVDLSGNIDPPTSFSNTNENHKSALSAVFASSESSPSSSMIEVIPSKVVGESESSVNDQQLIADHNAIVNGEGSSSTSGTSAQNKDSQEVDASEKSN